MIRKIIDDSCSLYDFNFKAYAPISKKAYKVKCSDNSEYFIKTSELYVQEKFKFLYNQGVNNVLYPIKNKSGDYISRSTSDFYMTNFLPDFYMLNEIKAVNMRDELSQLHDRTSFSRQLSPSKSRKKMDDIYEYLKYKFNMIEMFIRSVETRKFDEYSIVILKNYHSILDSKKVLEKLQKKIIMAVKEKRTVDYSFIHNNPRLDHLLSAGGNQYLISIEKAKLGISSLDLAKFYVDNADLNLDMKVIIDAYFKKYEDTFYFDYFCFLVLLIYIEQLVIVDKDYVSAQSFIFTAKAIDKFMITFELTGEK